MSISAEVAYLFRHAVIREAAYRLQPPSARAALHGTALAIMQAMPGASSDGWAEELADHARCALEAEGADKDSLLAIELDCLLRAAAHESRHWHNERAVALHLRVAAHPQGAPRAKMDALLEAVATLVRSGRPNLAPELVDRALELARDHGDLEAEAQALAAQCQARSILGDHAGAEQSNAAALKAARQVGEPDLEARVQITQAQIAQAGGDWSRSERAARRALELLQDRPDPQKAARSMLFIGDSCWQQGNLDEAEGHFRGALEIYTASQNLGGEASARDHLGSLLQENGRGDEAAAEHSRAAEIYADIGDSLGYGSAITNLASAILPQGRLIESRRYRLKALELFRASGATYLEGVGLGNLATVERRLGLLESALQRFQKARDVLHRAGRVVEEAVFDAMFGQLLLLLGFVDAAAVNARQAGQALTRIDAAKWREQYVGLLEVRIAIAQAGAVAERAARDRLAQMRDTDNAARGALGRAIESAQALIDEAAKPAPLLFRGHLVSELDPALRLALLDRAPLHDAAAQRLLQAQPGLLAAMREGTAGLAVPNWAAADADKV